MGNRDHSEREKREEKKIKIIVMFSRKKGRTVA